MRDLHDQLRSLVSQHGTGIAENAEQFRAALDDYLTEDDATQGELNLLVDAVRLGGVDRLLTMLENHADPDAAVREAGGELARDRSSDEQRARWAVAAMGYALGRVDAGIVRQQLEGDVTMLPYGATSPAAPQPPAQSPPTQSPPTQGPPFQSPGQSPPFQSPPFQSPAQSPGPDTAGPPAWPSRHSSGQPPVHSGPGYGSQPAPVPAYATARPQPRKSHTGLVVGLVTVAVVAIAGAIILALVLGGDDPQETADDDSGETTAGTTTACEGEGCLEGEGYTYELPEGWRDISESVKEENPAQGTLDTAAAWGGDTIAEGRANVIVEVAGWTYTDLTDARNVLKTNLSDLGGSIEEIDGRDFDGEEAAGVVLTRTNESGVEVEQTAYIMRNGDDAVVVTASNKANDNGPEDAYEEIYDSWAWE